MDKDLLLSVYPLLDHVLDLSPAERVAWLERLRIERPALAPGLEALLGHADELESRGFEEGEDWLSLVDLPPSLAGLSVGAYTLDRPLGRGGMGSVWLAHRSDGRYEGHVAVKLLNLALLDAVGRERFRREGTVLAKLDHPGIARLIDAGLTQGGQPFLVLEYVEGRQIDEYCDEARLTPEQRIALFLQVLAAVGHAHANLIVHRDLKTSNILVTGDASVKLLDFGIAKLLQGDAAAQRTALTEAGGLPLTPEFAAPEQVTDGAITTATDVYALGVLLYLLLAGRHPTAPGRATSAEHLRATIEIEPPRMSGAVTDGTRGRDEPARVATLRGTTAARLQRLYAGDLDNILAKALQKDPARRYPTVAALGDDLRRFLRHEPVEARTASLAYRARKFIRRNRAGVLAASVTLATLVGATAFSMSQMQEARRQRDAALEESRRKAAMSDVQSILAGDSRGPGGRTLSSLERIELAQRVLERKYRNQPAVVVEVMADLSGRLYDSGDLEGHRRILGRARDIARRADLPAQLALVACLRSSSYTYDDQLDSARFDLNEARAALTRVGVRSAPIEVQCLDAEGLLFVARQLPDSGVTVLRRALAITERTPIAIIRLQVLNNLATALRAAGQTREASRYQQQVLFELDSSGYTGTDILPSAMSFWASALSELGEFRAVDSIAGGYVRRLEAEWGSGQTGGVIASMYGTNKLRLGELDSAETWIGRAARDSSEAGLNVVAKMWLPPSLMQLRLDQGRAAEARRILRDLPVGTPVRQINRALLTARLRRLEGDEAGSRAALDSALRAAGGGPRPPPHLALALITAAEWHLADHDVRATDSLARLAIGAAALDSLALTRSGFVGRAELLRARAALATGNPRAAGQAANRAVVALTNGYGRSHPRTDEARRFHDSLPRASPP